MEDWIEEYDAEGASLLLNGRKVGMLFFEASFRTQVEGSIFHRQKKADCSARLDGGYLEGRPPSFR